MKHVLFAVFAAIGLAASAQSAKADLSNFSCSKELKEILSDGVDVEYRGENHYWILTNSESKVEQIVAYAWDNVVKTPQCLQVVNHSTGAQETCCIYYFDGGVYLCFFTPNFGPPYLEGRLAINGY